jgi:peptidoglycan hydrolase FlgJ
MGQIAKLMIESAAADDDAPGGHGEVMFRGVLAEKIGSEMARRGGIGLAPAIMQQIIALQQGDDNATRPR